MIIQRKDINRIIMFFKLYINKKFSFKNCFFTSFGTSCNYCRNFIAIFFNCKGMGIQAKWNIGAFRKYRPKPWEKPMRFCLCQPYNRNIPSRSALPKTRSSIPVKNWVSVSCPGALLKGPSSPDDLTNTAGPTQQTVAHNFLFFHRKVFSKYSKLFVISPISTSTCFL